MTVMVLSVFISGGHGKRDKVLYCSACKAIVDELNHSISQVDPKKTINVGGFRLNPDGTMKDKKVPLARSETHLNELLDGVCNSMSDYALYVDPDTQHKQYKRFAPRESGFTGDFPDFKNFQFAGAFLLPEYLRVCVPLPPQCVFSSLSASPLPHNSQQTARCRFYQA